MNRGGARGINAVEADGDHQDRKTILKMILEGDGDEEEMLDDIVGAVAKFRGRRPPTKGTPGERRPAARTPAAQPGGERRPAQPGQRRCPNCCGTHKEAKCPHPDVGREGRKCFNCDKPGHTAAACPKPKAVRSVEGGRASAVHGYRLRRSRRFYNTTAQGRRKMGISCGQYGFSCWPGNGPPDAKSGNNR